MELGLKGRRVLVTGATRGIGRATAEGFAREGCRLCLVARTGEALAETEAALADRYAVEIDTLKADLGEPGATQAVAAAFPEIDILVNNAGGIVSGSLVDVDESRWRAAWEPKVFGYINMTREYYRRMAARDGGVIVSIIGMAAEKVDFDYAAGASGNAALAALTRALGSASIDRGVRVVGIHPSWVDTDRALILLRERAEARFGDPERWPEVMATWPLNRLIAPREVADLVVFLASDRASAISGTIVTVDLGLGARSYPNPPETIDRSAVP